MSAPLRIRLLRASFALAFCACASPSHAALKSYFDARETFSSDVKPFPKWTGMKARYDKVRQIPDAQCGRDRFHPCTVVQWKELIARWSALPLIQRINAVNDYANAYPYTLDQVNWGLEDYWESPYEFLSISGDCEDYAIVKYYTLRATGIPSSMMRIIILQDYNLGGVIHAVLGVRAEDGTLYILDNQIKQVVRALGIYHYKPIYGINEEGWWAYRPG